MNQKGNTAVEVIVVILLVAALAFSIGFNIILWNRVSYVEGQVDTYAQVQRMDNSGQDLTQWLLDAQEWMVQVHAAIELNNLWDPNQDPE